jgi:hypothetical protein
LLLIAAAASILQDSSDKTYDRSADADHQCDIIQR